MRRARAVRRLGSAALDLAYVAAGRFDGFWERKLNPWDVAAGLILVREAGGFAGTIEGEGNPVEDRSLLAGNPQVYEQLRAAILAA